ncbi:MAG TPA: hypothetical protein VJW94_03830 [Candidatus Acidoferrum sp.]|nr:hypothetical protein [Candidatus Acidoferrum sp.]
MVSIRWLALFFLFTAVAQAQSWSVQTSGIDSDFRGISAAYSLDSNGARIPAVWVSGSNGVILRSVDSGKTWKRLHVPDGDTLNFRGVAAFDSNVAYMVSVGLSEKSRIYKTIDGGETWKLQYADKRKDFFLDAIACLSRTHCFALGDPVDGKFLILVMEDGEHWKELPIDNMPAALPQEGAFAASGSCLIVQGESIYFGTGSPAARVFHSSDLGSTWAVTNTPIVSGKPTSGIFSLSAGPGALFAVGGDYNDSSRSDRVAAFSRDQGKSWQLATQQPAGFRSAVAILNNGAIIVVGPTGEDISHDRGAHWEGIGSLNLNAIAALDEQNVWAAGPKGTVARLVQQK